jgi:hypothetical protein
MRAVFMLELAVELLTGFGEQLQKSTIQIVLISRKGNQQGQCSAVVSDGGKWDLECSSEH